MSPLLWKIVTVIVIFGTSMATIFLGIVPRFEEIESNAQQLQTTQLQAQLNQSTLEKLIVQAKDKPLLESKLDAMMTAVPQQLAISSLVSELNTLAEQSEVVVGSVQFADPVAYVAPQQVLDNPALKDIVAKIPDNTLYVIDVNLVATGSLDKLINFVNLVQNGPRTLLAYQVQVTGGLESDEYTLNFGAQIFVYVPTSS